MDATEPDPKTVEITGTGAVMLPNLFQIVLAAPEPPKEVTDGK